MVYKKVIIPNCRWSLKIIKDNTVYNIYPTSFAKNKNTISIHVPIIIYPANSWKLEITTIAHGMW